MLQSYKQKYEISDSFDVICIGSGLGSLSTAALLAKEGQKVLVLERHYTAGGFTHIFKRRGYEWDVGIHYIGEMQRENSILKHLFDYVTDGKLKWADMGEVYDRIVIGEEVFDYVKGANNFKKRMLDYFPKEAEAIGKYMELIFEATKASRNFYLEKALPPLLSKVSSGLMRSAYMKFAEKTTLEVMESITNNPKLIKVLTGQYGDYGLPPSQSSFAMHAAVVRHYFSGGNFPVGGSSRILETILPVITEAGGAVLVSADVDKVIIENNKAVGVRMKDGKDFRAKNIVSGAGIMTTYKKLLPKALVEKHNLKTQLKKVKNSVAHVCLYIGFKESPEDLQLPKANYWVYPEEGTHDECVERYSKDINAEFPVVYVSFPAAKDPDWSNRYPNKSTVDIITLMPYEVFEPWEDTRWKKRGEDYEALKEKISQRLLETLYRLEPQLKGKVAYYELSTPITTKHFVNYEKGEIYGLSHGPDRFKNKFLRPHTPIKNLYLTGQDIVSAGVGAALLSGLLTASAMTKKNFLKKLSS